MVRRALDPAVVVDWYDERARGFIEQYAADHLSALDEQRRRVAEIARVKNDGDVPVCLLGAAGVGKSTLLNAVVDPRVNVLPHGGIGALTAQATIVRYAERPFLRVQYFGAPTLKGILLSLERWHERSLGRPSESSDLERGLAKEDLYDAESVVPVASEAANPSEKLDAYQKQFRLLVKGDQNGTIDLPYLMDAVRSAVGLQARWGTTLDAGDAARVGRVRTCIDAATDDRPVHREVAAADGDSGSFFAELKDHASGFLAPIIKHLEVGWNAAVLSDGLVLVDLPGVGIAADQYRDVTTEWIRNRARAIALVVDTRGVTEASAELLRSTHFLNRLLHDIDDPAADPVTLALVMVKVDQTADSEWQDERNAKGKDAKRWIEHFNNACERGKILLREQLRQQLQRISDEGSEATKEARESVIARLLEGLQVHPVSAPQYRLLHLDDEEAKPRIKTEDESRIPELASAFHNLAHAHRQRREAARTQAAREFASFIATTIDLVRVEWEQDTRAEREAEKLREDLDEFLAPRQRELEVRRGAFLEFLTNGVRARIDGGVADAAHVARHDISRYVKRLEGMHWATLRAAVRRGGTYDSRTGKNIDVPGELTLRFEEPIAVVWSKHILAELRKRTSQLGDDYVALVSEVVEWAQLQEARVQPRFVEALRDNLIAETKGLATVGKEAVDELKEKVRAQLYKRLEKRIRDRCETFVKSREDEGRGVKDRILHLFRDELVDGVDGIITIAQPAAAKVLTENYGDVEKEIRERLATYKNPLARSRDALVQSHEDSVRRSDRVRRKRVLDHAAEVIAKAPKGVTA